MKKQKYPKPDVWSRLYQAIFRRTSGDVIYVYRVGSDDRPITPFLEKYAAYQYPDFHEFPEWLRETHGAGYYRLLIRRGRKMIFSGNIGLAELNRGTEWE